MLIFLRSKKLDEPVFAVEKYAQKPAPKIPFDMPEIKEPIFSEQVCNILEYGAIGDGSFVNTNAINNAISDCAKKGGGRVVVPPGKWFTGKISLQSNINLNVEKESEIIFSDKFSDYLPTVFSRFEGIELYNYSPFIYAKDCKNIALTGDGTINGQGEKWLKWNDIQNFSVNELYGRSNNVLEKISIERLYSMMTDNIPVNKRIFGNEKDALQPSFVQFVNCENILVEGITIINSPSWTLHPLYSSNIIIRNININTAGRNNDGVVVDSSKNVLIENSTFHTGDDAIVIKSGKDEDGRRVGKPSENIIVHDYKVEEAHSALAIGSEMSGGVKNILAYNLDINYSDFGIRMKSMRGRGGIVENIFVDNVYMKLIKEDAIQIDLDYGTPLPDYNKDKPPIFQNISIKNIGCKKAKSAAFLNGLEESPLKNITLENIKIKSKNAITSNFLKSKSFKNIEVKIKDKIIQLNDF